MTIHSDAELVTGTSDRDYNLLWFAETALSNALRMEQFRDDAIQAGDEQVADFFSRAQVASRRGADEAKALLTSRLVANAPSA